MDRIPEPEVMDDPAQAVAYARADFAEVNQAFVDRFRATFPDFAAGRVVDLGCGPADIPIRLARSLPGAAITAVDASAPMLDLARRAVAAAALAGRVLLVEGRLPGLPLPAGGFDAVISNSLVHQLPDPAPFWQEARRLGRPGAAILVVDLSRPGSPAAARAIVETYSADEDPVLKRDFFNSLCAAFTPDEVAAQLRAALLGHLRAEVISDRHWAVAGRL
ncbi:MAG TPA: class I SAM-dependent methyltransferase [Candidatus Methylomirabilis sp.]|jgi:ubiquinone/menaquinone biosynthesis C-methylase UbiE